MSLSLLDAFPQLQTMDSVSMFVGFLLMVMSISSWYVIATKTLQHIRYRRFARTAGYGFWDTTNINDGVETLGHGNPFANLARAGIAAEKHHNAHQGHLHDQLSLSDWITLSLRQSIEESSGTLQRGMGILASVGSTAPFVGLFGTVWGIYHALLSISASGQSNLSQIAGPIGEALIMTGLGLAVAIPASFGYNTLVRNNKALMSKLNKFGFDLHALFITGARTSTNLHLVEKAKAA